MAGFSFNKSPFTETKPDTGNRDRSFEGESGTAATETPVSSDGKIRGVGRTISYITHSIGDWNYSAASNSGVKPMDPFGHLAMLLYLYLGAET